MILLLNILVNKNTVTRKNMKKILLTLILSMFLSTSLFAESMYVRTFRATVFTQPKFNAEKLEKLKRGTKVEVVKKGKNWTHIKQGWVNTRLLTVTKKKEKISLLANNKVDLSKSARRRASALSSTASARGLREGQIAAKKAKEDFEALEKIERTRSNYEQQAMEFTDYDERDEETAETTK